MAGNANSSGVYVEELFSLSLSVQSSATAVVAFVGEAEGLPAGVTRVNNWLDAQSLFPEADGGGKGATAAWRDALRGYFYNGGGYCYLASTAGTTLDGALKQLSAAADVTIVVAPGLWDQGAETAGEWARGLTGWAAGHRAMAVLHADRDHTPDQAGEAVDAWAIDEAQKPYAAVYFPWLRQDGQEEPVPPSALVVGAWATVDRERGVWKAPANIPVKGPYKVLYKASDQEQGSFRSLNFLREFTGSGTVVWGARTLSDSDEWRYIPIRRLFSSVERDLGRALPFAVFEPNSQPTWEKVRAAAENYLYSLWQQGALQGGTPEEAYFVQVGKGITMTQDDIASGRLILKIGLAAFRPAEFQILQLTQQLDS